MPHYLVVANQTLGGDHLLDEVRDCLREGGCRFHIVVPATEPRDHAVTTEGEARALAQERLDRALARFRDLGAQADGEIGDERPMDAIRDAIRGRDFDGIILSTLPPRISRWLGQDLPHRVEREFGLPLRHVVGQAEPAGPRS
jgi:hypothetical protein